MSRPRLRVCLALGLASLCAGCGAPTAGLPAARPPVAVSPAPGAGQPTAGWHLTVYYTPVESYHGPPLKSIADCAGAALGQHSADFLDHIQTEGFGRVVAPVHGKRYLGWDFDRRCWYMAATPLAANNKPLRAWLSTAAPDALAVGTRLRVVGCGSEVADAVCARVQAAHWTVDDRCSVGCDDPRHLDLYIGEEDQPDFEDQSPNYFEAHGAAVALLG